jgi:maltooligosyltrehalose trehalohydrolase
VGAEPQPDGGVHFRVWAPDHERVAVVIDGTDLPLEREEGGWWAGVAPDAGVGGRYGFRLGDEDRVLADPASRFQPDGPDGPSEVIDPSTFRWSDAAWPGIELPGQVVYELHVGTFTREGTWAAAARRLEHLADLGVTVVEVMPVAEFGGTFGWGYDGVDLFAPYHHYGRPDDMRAFVDRAHALGVAVILDVVYNHFGPTGNYLPVFAAAYQSEHQTEWGPTYNFDGPGAEGMRALVLANVEHWIREYHLDGFRLDATQSIRDESERHIVAELIAHARAAAGARTILEVAEDERQGASHLASVGEGGWCLDALWNDDAHHSAIVALTGRKHSYYSDYLGGAAEMVASVLRGFLYQGQYYPWQKMRRGEPSLGIPPGRFVLYLENHDQVANSERGDRLAAICHPAQLRAMTGQLLLGPGTPMLFQGQEWGASAPFLYFADHSGELGAAVRKGRAEFLEQFRTLQDPKARALFVDPGSRADSFAPCALDWSELERPLHARWLALHRDLLRLRREDRTIARGGETGVEAAVLSPFAWVLRWRAVAPEGDRLLIVNIGREMDYAPPSEPLLAPPLGLGWRTIWSSESPTYGGRGTPDVETERGWVVPGPCAVLLAPIPPSAPDQR